MNFIQLFFDAVTLWAEDLNAIIHISSRIARVYGLAAMDALNIAAALSINAHKFVTTEKITKPIHRVTEIRVVSISI